MILTCLLLVSQGNQKKDGSMFDGGSRGPSFEKNLFNYIVKTNHFINPSFKKPVFSFFKNRDLVPCAPHH